MAKSFINFLDSLRQFESGVYGTPSDTLRNEQYESENSLRFVGYQFGEAILKDLGYYKADQVYTWDDTLSAEDQVGNTWEGEFTGKDGVYDIYDLKTNVQESIILDEFGNNLTAIDQMLRQGTHNPHASVSDYFGKHVYLDNGHKVAVNVTETGVLAAAHLVGASGVADLLLTGQVHHDENGTSALTYMKNYGGYNAPSVSVLEVAHKQHTTQALSEVVWHHDFNHDKVIGDGAHHAGWDLI